jgi:hypothetical protein
LRSRVQEGYTSGLSPLLTCVSVATTWQQQQQRQQQAMKQCNYVDAVWQQPGPSMKQA